MGQSPTKSRVRPARRPLSQFDPFLSLSLPWQTSTELNHTGAAAPAGLHHTMSPPVASSTLRPGRRRHSSPSFCLPPQPLLPQVRFDLPEPPAVRAPRPPRAEELLHVGPGFSRRAQHILSVAPRRKGHAIPGCAQALDARDQVQERGHRPRCHRRGVSSTSSDAPQPDRRRGPWVFRSRGGRHRRRPGASWHPRCAWCIRFEKRSIERNKASGAKGIYSCELNDMSYRDWNIQMKLLDYISEFSSLLK